MEIGTEVINRRGRCTVKKIVTWNINCPKYLTFLSPWCFEKSFIQCIRMYIFKRGKANFSQSESILLIEIYEENS